METEKKELTTAELLDMVRRGDESRRLKRVKTTVENGPCDVTFVLPPPGTLENKLAVIRTGGEKKMTALAQKLVSTPPSRVKYFMSEYQRELANNTDAVRAAENEAYADYVVDIRDRKISPDGKSFVKLEFFSEAVYMEGAADMSPDTVIEFSRELVLLLFRSDGVRTWFIAHISNVGLYNALRKDAAIKNSEPSRNGAPVESLPVANAPTGNLSNLTAQEDLSSISTGMKPGESLTKTGQDS